MEAFISYSIRKVEEGIAILKPSIVCLSSNCFFTFLKYNFIYKVTEYN